MFSVARIRGGWRKCHELLLSLYIREDVITIIAKYALCVAKLDPNSVVKLNLFVNADLASK